MTSNLDLERRVSELEARLRAVEDVQEIQRLKARYGTLADARYDRRGPKPRPELERIARAISELFTEDAVWDGGAALGRAQGRDAIYQRFVEPTLLFSWHCFVKPEIEVRADLARGRWDILAPCTTRDGRPHWMAGYEEDDYRRVGGVWLHARMELGVVFLAPHETGWRR
jgi:hypothetical protein